MVAGKPIDLETAVYAVSALCANFINAERLAFIADYPGYRNEVEVAFRRVEAARLDEARIVIASIRAR